MIRRMASTSWSGSPKQDWSDGKVGTFGTSYPGGTQHALAEMNPPHLTAMVPIDAVSNCGVSGMRHGGAFELRFMNWIFQIGAPNCKAALANPALRQALVENGRRIRQHADSLPVRPGTTPLRVVPEYESWLVEAMRSGPESPFWHTKGMSVVDHVGDYADVPVLHVTGWYDSWTRQVTMNYEALSKAKKSPQRLVIGPWVHGGQNSNVAGEVEFTPRGRHRPAGFPAAVVRPLAARERRTASTTTRPCCSTSWAPATTAARPPAGSRHGGFWRAEREWPLARARATPYFLTADGTLNRTAPDVSGADDLHLRPAASRADGWRQYLVEPGADHQRRLRPAAARRHPRGRQSPSTLRAPGRAGLSDPRRWNADLEVTGTTLVKLWVSSTAPDTDFTAKLIDEIPPNPDYPARL